MADGETSTAISPEAAASALAYLTEMSPDLRGGAILAEDGSGIDAVVQLVADQDELVGRLLKRAQEQGRSDDNEETIRRRQEVYTEQTAPIVAAYAERGLVVDVDGLGGIDEVGDRIATALAGRGLTAGV